MSPSKSHDTKMSVCSSILSLSRPQALKTGSMREEQGYSIHVRSFIHSSSPAWSISVKTSTCTSTFCRATPRYEDPLPSSSSSARSRDRRREYGRSAEDDVRTKSWPCATYQCYVSTMHCTLLMSLNVLQEHIRMDGLSKNVHLQ